MKLFVGFLLIVSGMAAWWTLKIQPDLRAKTHSSSIIENRKSVPVLVELFTSEGCSSCPPADKLLSKLNEQPIDGVRIIALGEHVDYWNNLGWRDPYSSLDFSKRQRSYADAFGTNSVYTPQLIVDGQKEFVGSDETRARTAIIQSAKTAKAKVEFRLASEPQKNEQRSYALLVTVNDLPLSSVSDTAEVFVAVTEDNLSSDVSRGENAGRLLKHTAVVRQLFLLGEVPRGNTNYSASSVVQLASNWQTQNLQVVVFVQERASRRVLGAATSEVLVR